MNRWNLYCSDDCLPSVVSSDEPPPPSFCPHCGSPAAMLEGPNLRWGPSVNLAHFGRRVDAPVSEPLTPNLSPLPGKAR